MRNFLGLTVISGHNYILVLWLRCLSLCEFFFEQFKAGGMLSSYMTYDSGCWYISGIECFLVDINTFNDIRDIGMFRGYTDRSFLPDWFLRWDHVFCERECCILLTADQVKDRIRVALDLIRSSNLRQRLKLCMQERGGVSNKFLKEKKRKKIFPQPWTPKTRFFVAQETRKKV